MGGSPVLGPFENPSLYYFKATTIISETLANGTQKNQNKIKSNKKSFVSINVKIFSNSPLLFTKITY